jgi:hypothetical protein
MQEIVNIDAMMRWPLEPLYSIPRQNRMEQTMSHAFFYEGRDNAAVLMLFLDSCWLVNAVLVITHTNNNQTLILAKNQVLFIISIIFKTRI